MFVISVLLLIFFSFILIKSADGVVVSLRRIAKATRTGVFALSVIILALGTSFPELFVGITSALEGVSNLSLGVILGSNIANISLIAGLAAVWAGKVNVHGDFLKRDIWVAAFAGVLPFILSLDGSLNRLDGLMLVIFYALYLSSYVKRRYQHILDEHKKEDFFHRLFRKLPQIEGKILKDILFLVFWLSMLLVSADFIVRISKAIAEYLNIPVFIIGLIFIAIGTSLPELAFSLRSIKDKEPSMFFGNLLGSTIINSTLIIGVVLIIRPIEKVYIVRYMIPALFFIAIYLYFWHFIKTKNRLERWEAVILLTLYASFVIIELF